MSLTLPSLTGHQVHVVQWNGQPKAEAPGGFIEGIADFLRLKSSYIPSHWHLAPGGSWQDGYQRTGYFLNWLEQAHCPNFVAAFNASLRLDGYQQKVFETLTGFELQDLWFGFQTFIREQAAQSPTKTLDSPIVPTHSPVSNVPIHNV
jgi:hypothetical protein